MTTRIQTDAIMLRSFGGPQELRLERIAVSPPRPGEVMIRHTAINVNFHDIYVRTGQYRTLALPGTPGLDAVGRVEMVGEGVSSLRLGQRVAWVNSAYSGYAERKLLPADLAIPLPDTISDEAAAATLMKAMTVRMLIKDCFRVQAGQTVLVHAAAGGVGQLLCQWCSALGARVIATVGSTAKAEIARASGAADTILYREENFVARVLELTGGTGVAAAFDSVGKDTFDGSLRCLDFGGMLVNYGQSSGPVAPFTPADLATRSLCVTRPILFHWIRTAETLQQCAFEALGALADGTIRAIDPVVLQLDQAAEAHRMLEAGESPGGIVLVPAGDETVDRPDHT